MFTQTSGKTPHRVFSVAFPGHKMRVHLLTAPDDILVIWVSPIQLLLGPIVALQSNSGGGGGSWRVSSSKRGK
jgi:hypothetical protein